jgi:hypothetical protein
MPQALAASASGIEGMGKGSWRSIEQSCVEPLAQHPVDAQHLTQIAIDRAVSVPDRGQRSVEVCRIDRDRGARISILTK